jgi:DNA-binding NarL/FixJ family response regulator
MRIVIGEDQVLLREGLIRLLEESGHEVVGSAGDGPDMVRKAKAHRPDLVIADVRMPPSQTDEGLRAALEIRSAAPGVGILVLSHHVVVRYALELLSGDASGVGYLLKQRVADLDRFFAALERIHAGGSVIDPEVVSALLGRARQDPIDRLTPRQREVLALMAEGCTNAGIAEELVITEKAVAKHVAGIFEALGLPPSADGNRRVLAVIQYLDAQANLPEGYWHHHRSGGRGMGSAPFQGDARNATPTDHRSS